MSLLASTEAGKREREIATPKIERSKTDNSGKNEAAQT